MSNFHDSNPQSDTVTIPATRGETIIVDRIDADLADLKWSTMVGRTKYYAVRGKRSNGKQKTILMHRVIVERVLGRPLQTGEAVDHINGNGMDNRRSNLRVCTNAENARNSRRPTNNKSGYKGVSWDRAKRLWCAHIMVDRRCIALGRYKTPEEAHAAYCEAAKRLHGEFARFE